MPYNPQFGTNHPNTVARPWPGEPGWPGNQQVTGHNPQQALYLPPARTTPAFVRAGIKVVCVGVVLLVLAQIAFTPAAMNRFWLGVGSEISWLTGSQQGNRLGSFILFALGIIGSIAVVRAIIIANSSHATWGWVQVCIGVTLLGWGGFGWYIGHVYLLWALGMGFIAWMLIDYGAKNIKAVVQQVEAPPPVYDMVPSHDTHSAGWATPQEIHQAWAGRSTDNEGTVWD